MHFLASIGSTAELSLGLAARRAHRERLLRGQGLVYARAFTPGRASCTRVPLPYTLMM